MLPNTNARLCSSLHFTGGFSGNEKKEIIICIMRPSQSFKWVAGLKAAFEYII